MFLFGLVIIDRELPQSKYSSIIDTGNHYYMAKGSEQSAHEKPDIVEGV